LELRHFIIEKIRPFWCKAIGWTELRFLGHGDIISPDYLDLIVKIGEEISVIKVLLEYLMNNDKVDIINLTDISASSSTLKIIESSHDFISTYNVEKKYSSHVLISTCQIVGMNTKEVYRKE